MLSWWVVLGLLGNVHDVEPLIAQLGSKDDDVRKASCEALGKIGDVRAVEPLIARLGDKNHYVRQTACVALGKLGDVRAVKPLIARLGDDYSVCDEYVRHAACKALGKLGDVRAVGPLIARLRDNDLYVRKAAYEALVAIGPASVEPLIVRLGGYSSDREDACEALEKLGEGRLANAVIGALSGKAEAREELRRLATQGDIRAVKPLIALLGDCDDDVRKASCKALGKIGDVCAVEPLIARLGDKDSNVRKAACEALGELGEGRLANTVIGALSSNTEAREELRRLATQGDVRAVEPLARLEDWHSDVCHAACVALVAIGHASVEPLITRLGDEREYVRKAACEALGNIGDVRAVEPLIARLEDWRSDVCHAACEALGNIGDVRAIKPLIVRLGGYSSDRENACEALGKLGEGRLANAVIGALSGNAEAREELHRLATQGDVRAVEPLIAQLGSRDSNVRQAACEALVAIGHASVEPLITRVGNWREYVHKAACEALGNIGDVRAVEPLIARLEDWRSDVRQAACEALVAIGHASVEPLITRVGNWREYVHKAACEALGKLGDVRAVEPLIAQLGSKDSNVRQVACEALVVIGLASVEPLIARLGDKDSNVRQVACEALRELGEGQLANAVIGALSGNAEARKELRRLAKQGDVRAVEPLIALLENFYVCKAACEALNSIYKTVKPRIREMLCRTHLTRFETKVDRYYVDYVACRICGKSDQAMFGVKKIIATLDAGMEEDFICANGTVRGNWLKRVDLFDFDRVEIIQASDYDVERFCIQVGKDMDNLRRKRYRKMPCIVDPRCGLSESAMNMLRSRFGKVSEAV